MIVVIWGLFRKGLVAGSSHWEGSDICIGRRYCRFQIYCQPRYFSTDNAILPGNFVEFLLNFTHHIDVVHKVGKDRNCKHPMFKSASLHPSLFDFHSAQRYNVKTDTTHTSIIKHPKGCSCSNLKPVLVTLVRVCVCKWVKVEHTSYLLLSFLYTLRPENCSLKSAMFLFPGECKPIVNCQSHDSSVFVLCNVYGVLY